MSVGMPQEILLQQFGELIHDAFGDWPYLVGSALQGKQWRDVDVRLILSDEDYERLTGDKVPINPPILNRKWAALCLAFSTLGREMTGLPIDFQIQQRTEANRQYDGPRSALILYADISRL
jgi:predicted nucleotidyltransferase